MSDTTPKRSLAYAPYTEVRQLRRARRLHAIVLALFCLAALGSVTAFVCIQGPYLYVQRECLTYSPKPGRVVYDSGGTPGTLNELIASDGRYVRIRSVMPTTQSAGALFTQKAWYDLIHDVEAARSIESQEIRGPLFLHERTSSTTRPSPGNLKPSQPSHRRLVAVELCDSQYQQYQDDALRLWVFEPVTMSWPPRVCWSERRSIGVLGWAGLQRGGLRLFAGESDPGDGSHFTIRFMLGDQPGTIDGWIEADDRLTLRVRNEAQIWERGHWYHE